MSLAFRVIPQRRLQAIVVVGPAGELTPIPADTALGNFTNASAIATAQDKNQWVAWLDVPTNFAFGQISATVIGIAGDLVDLETIVNSKIDVTQNDFNPSSNIFTIGTTANSQRIRLRRRFASASDFSQLSIDFSADNCRLQTQQSGNPANPIVLGTNGTDRVFLHGTNSWMGIGGMPTTRPLEILATTAGFRLQSIAAISAPSYTEIARTFDFLTWQNSISPFDTFTDLIANTNQFNAHSIRFFVHTSGTSAPVLSTVFHASGRVSVGDGTDDGVSRLRVVGNLACTGLMQVGTFTVATLPSASANAGRLAQVTDSSVTANGSPVAGGGANRVLVFSTGTTWDVVVA